ncbi:cysteine desulfurase [Sandaracinobacter neustonicus]|uniref:cysteine desulfurase n=2 Tax=Sandaracinobacter neustonicus TaxID=1715348 RepID=A0A501XHV3_9SPHN|nr:cysteine desulfurase [Sandaracinobacter neustonicus]TPE60211.1 cysteine desulfurase [Sandaracinobacter neustonicus]
MPLAAHFAIAPALLDLRGEFPALPEGWAYLDAAATAQKPRAVIEAIEQAYARDYATVHRGVYARSAHMTEAYEAAREAAARFINGRADETIFVRGATEAINLVANSWGDANIGPGDRILLTQLEHHANIVPWRMLADRTGAEIDVAPLTEDGRIDEAALIALIGPATKLVAVAHVSNVLGSVADIAKIAASAHAMGAKLLVDGCQAAPRLAVDVVALGADFYAFSAHKLYGPTGIGVLWVRKSILDTMPPWQGGGAMIDEVRFERVTYASAPQRFEAGTPHIAGAIGLHAAIRWVEGVGIEAIDAHERALLGIARAELSRLNSVRLFGPADSAGILSFAVGAIHPHDVATILDEGAVAIRAGHHCAQPLMRWLGVPATARASFSAHSTEGDVAKLVAGIERTQRIFG